LARRAEINPTRNITVCVDYDNDLAIDYADRPNPHLAIVTVLIDDFDGPTQEDPSREGKTEAALDLVPRALDGGSNSKSMHDTTPKPQIDQA
jgi:hypothetical protein